MAVPRLSVILLTKNPGPVFREVLEVLFRCRGIEEGEVLVLDSGSTDGTLEEVRQRSAIRLITIPPEAFGHGRTRNLGASLARGETLIFLVQDATPADPDFLQLLTAPLADPKVAGVYGRQLPRPETHPVERYFLESTYPNRPETRELARNEPTRIQAIFFSNVCSAIRRSVWERFPFDETLIMSEDQRWARQVLEAGFRIVYEPRAAVYHSHNYRLREIFQRNFDSGFSLRGIAEDRFLDMLRYQTRFVAAGLRYLHRRRLSRWIPYFLLYEAARGTGFFAGQRLTFLPRRWKRALSLHKGYWEKRSGGP